MKHLIQTMRISGFLILILVILGFGSAISAQETAMQMVYGQRSIAMPLPKDRIVVRSNYPFMDTVSRIKEAIESKDCLIIANTDHQELLKLVGLQTGGMLGIEFFHPRYGKVIAKNDAAAALEMPFRILVMEAQNGKVLMAFYRPSSALA
ncbi:MAG: DUF302 domain-containing protein, partial [Nitrospinales bacterium]